MKTTAPTSLILLLSAFLLLPVQAVSQVAVGVQGGVAIANLTGDDIDDDEFDSKTGLLAGGFVTLPVHERVGLTTGLYYVQKGATEALSGEDFDVKADYLEIPLLLHLAVAGNESTGIAIFAGPSISFEVNCEIEGESGGVNVTFDCDSPELEDGQIETKSTLFNAIVGAGVRHNLTETMFLTLNGGVDFGLQSVDDSAADEDVKHRVWFAHLGVGWMLGGDDMGGM